MSSRATSNERRIPLPPLDTAAAGSHDDTRSTIVASSVKPDGNEPLSPTLPTAPLRSDPTRTSASVDPPILQPRIVVSSQPLAVQPPAIVASQPAGAPTHVRAAERYQILCEHG